MSKHTPGPWTWRNEPFDDGTPFFVITAGIGFFGSHSTLPSGFCASGIMSEANARLIASAPELLAALEAMMQGAEWAPSGDNTRFVSPASDVAKAARAAIAKVKGE